MDSIPSALTVADTDGDGFTDRIVVGDSGGNVWRADLVGSNVADWKLTQLAQYCTALGVEPDGVTDKHPRGLLKALVEESFVNRPEHVAANAIKTWNRIKHQVDGWPDIELTPLPPKKFGKRSASRIAWLLCRLRTVTIVGSRRSTS